MKKDEKAVEALLFVHGEPISVKRISGVLGKNDSVVKGLISKLKKQLEERSSLRIIEKDGKVQMVTAPEYSSLIKKLFRSKHTEDLTRAALEVLSIVAYAGPISREEIETIRGVNSAYTIRGLMLRDLIETKRGKGKIKYELSFEAQRKFGAQKKEDLPGWKKIRSRIEETKQALTQPNERNN